jgi:class 3 adenylate cyclase
MNAQALTRYTPSPKRPLTDGRVILAIYDICDSCGVAQADIQNYLAGLLELLRRVHSFQEAQAEADEHFEVVRIIGDEVRLVCWLPPNADDSVTGQYVVDVAKSTFDIIRFLSRDSNPPVKVKATICECRDAANGLNIKRALASQHEVLRTYEPLIPDGEAWGNHVNLASRIAGIADAYQVLVDPRIKQYLDVAAPGEFATSEPLHFALKGFEESMSIGVPICHVISQHSDAPRPEHLIMNYGFGALLLIRVAGDADEHRRENACSLLAAFSQQFPGPMLASAYERIPWGLNDTNKKAWREPERFDLVLALLATNYEDYSRRVALAMAKEDAGFEYSLTNPIWKPSGPYQMRADTGGTPTQNGLAATFYQIDKRGEISADMSADFVHFAVFRTRSFAEAHALSQRAHVHWANGYNGSPIGQVEGSWITLGANGFIMANAFKEDEVLLSGTVPRAIHDGVRRDIRHTVEDFVEEARTEVSEQSARNKDYIHWVARRIHQP